MILIAKIVVLPRVQDYYFLGVFYDLESLEAIGRQTVVENFDHYLREPKTRQEISRMMAMCPTKATQLVEDAIQYKVITSENSSRQLEEELQSKFFREETWFKDKERKLD